METIELKYFLKIAETENIHRASERLNISPSTLSKAVSRLEADLEVKLFQKSGRNIVLTKQGKRLITDARTMLALQKQILEGYSDDKKDITLKIVGPEVPLSQYAPGIVKNIKSKFIGLKVDLEAMSNEEAFSRVNDYSADLAIFTSIKKQSGPMFKSISDVEFKVFASKKHALYSTRHQEIPAKDIIKESFFMTEPGFFGDQSNQSTIDGWRDDKFERPTKTVTNSIKCLEEFLKQGLALAYLPKYYGESLGLFPLKISNCPYTCRQKLYVVRNKYSLDKVWSLL